MTFPENINLKMTFNLEELKDIYVYVCEHMRIFPFLQKNDVQHFPLLENKFFLLYTLINVKGQFNLPGFSPLMP